MMFCLIGLRLVGGMIYTCTVDDFNVAMFNV